MQVATILALWGVVISAVYMLRAYRQTFQGPSVSVTESAKDLKLSDQIPAIILAAALLVVGLYPNSLLSHLKKPPCCSECDQSTEQAEQ